MHDTLIQAICSAYHIGECLSKPTLCTGGLLNQTWKMNTSKGQYILKILNHDVINLVDQKENYRIRESIASMLQNTISLVCAIKQNDDPLYQFENDIVMLFPYINGKLLDQNSILPIHTTTIGKAIAKIHTANIKLNHPPATNLFNPVILNNFDNIQNKLNNKYLDIDITSLQWLLQQYQQYIPILSENLVISHRDCDPKNVLWDLQGHYYLIDWESAGLINRTHDIFATAIYWSLDQYYRIKMSALKNFIDSYINNQGIIEVSEIKAGWYGLLGDWLGWLDFNLNRILTQPKQSTEFQLGLSEAKKTLHALPIICNQFTEIISSIKQYITKILKNR